MRIDAIVRKLSDRQALDVDPTRQMIEDSRLPADVQTSRPFVDVAPRHILLTGATGFLGGYLLRSLLQDSDVHVSCLVRNSVTGFERIRTNLESSGSWDESFADRFDVMDGDLERNYVGIDRAVYDRLAKSVDSIFHCAAAVNWIYPYRRLAGTNVRGTLELLRFACAAKTKEFHFISSSSVCMSSVGPRQVDETDDMLPHIAGIHLGYAQAKCVAESLVRQARDRGIPATIYRPALISGDSRSGYSNNDDFVSRFIKGCIQIGSAPELNWLLDCCPVDFTAEAIVKLSRSPKRHSVIHIVNPDGRYWGECILWINLFGYPVRLLPYRVWLAALKRSTPLPHQALRQLAPFFCSDVSSEPGVYLPQLYEEDRKSAIASTTSDAAIRSAGISCPPLNAQLLDRYFGSFLRTGFLPEPEIRHSTHRDEPSEKFDPNYFSSILQRNVVSAVPFSADAGHSIITELTSWRFRNASGLFPYRLTLDSGQSVDVMVKVKPRDIEVLEVGREVAGLCSKELGDAYSAFADRLEFKGCHLREPAIYTQKDPRFRAHTPRCFGARDMVLILEFVTDVSLKDSADDISGWNTQAITAAVEGLASLHALWFERGDDLLHDASIGPTLKSTEKAEMIPFWQVLGQHALPFFSEWAGSDMSSVQDFALRTVETQDGWSHALPLTLIHNDFNPRNLALRNVDDGYRLCAYDWEMARLGLPQHDLAELLCFVLTPAASEVEVLAFLDLHRHALEHSTGIGIDKEGWLAGFRLSLLDLLVNRFAMYTMLHRFRKQSFLERVVQTWRRLHDVTMSFPIDTNV